MKILVIALEDIIPAFNPTHQSPGSLHASRLGRRFYSSAQPSASGEDTDRRMSIVRAPSVGQWLHILEPRLLADLLSGGGGGTLLIDTRSFLEYNTSHVINAINVGCSKIIKRRLEQNKLSIQELLSTSSKLHKTDATCDVVVYDASTQDINQLAADSFTVILLAKLNETFKSVSMLSGGFTAFKTSFPYLCESQSQPQCAMLGSTLAQPCLPVTKVGPTRVLNYLFIGSQQDVLNEDIMRANGINYVLNVSKTCPSPTHIAPGHFHRIPVRDNYGEKLLPWFDDAMDFIEKVHSANGRVIVHCLAGISRSPTVAIAYIMKHLNMNVDDAYKYVKEKRQSISPNFNFLGQLLEFERCLHGSKHASTTTTTSVVNDSKPTSQVQRDPTTSPSHPVVHVTKPEVPFPAPILLAEETRNEATTPNESRTYKRSISQQKEGEVLSPPSPVPARIQSPKIRSRTIPRPCGLNVAVSKVGPIFLGSPPLSESKKPRSGNSSPCGLLEQLAWGTRNLSVNSPEVRNTNPFVEACAKLAEQQAQEKADIGEETVLNQMITCPSPSDTKKLARCKDRDGDAPNSEVKVERPYPQPTSTQESNNSTIHSTGANASMTNIAQENQRRHVEAKRRSNLKSDGGVKPKVGGQCKSPRLNAGPRRCQSSPKSQQPAPPKLQVNIKPNRREIHRHTKTKKTSDTSVGFEFGTRRVEAVLPTTGTKCELAVRTKTKELPQLMVAKRVHVQLETPNPLSPSAGRKNSQTDRLTPFFSRQMSSQSQSSDNSSGISPSCESEVGSHIGGSPGSSGVTPDFPNPSPNLFDSLGNLVSSPLMNENKSCSTCSTISETASSHRVTTSAQNRSPPSAAAEDVATNVLQKRKESGDCFEEHPNRSSDAAAFVADRLSGYSSSRSYGLSDQLDCERNEPRSARKTPINVTGRSLSCEEISSCAREAAVSEIVVRPRRELHELSGYAGMDGEEDDHDSRSLSSQRSLSSSCEMIEVS